VAEADVGKLVPGMAATFTVDAYPRRTFRGVVREVRNAPQSIQNVVTYDAVIDVENEDLKLKPGMTARVCLVYDEREDVLRVPNAAFRFRPPGARGADKARSTAGSTEPSAEQRALWKLSKAAPERIAVKTGLSDGVLTEIVSGQVQAGDRIAIDVVGAADDAESSGVRKLPRLF